MSMAIAETVIAEMVIDNRFRTAGNSRCRYSHCESARYLVHWAVVIPHDETVTRLLHALREIEDGAAENVERSIEIQRRVRFLRERLEAGEDLVGLVRREEPPRVVELLSTNMATLETVGAQLRASQALALRAEGLTIESIAELFGVTRQRISALLKQKAATEV